MVNSINQKGTERVLPEFKPRQSGSKALLLTTVEYCLSPWL